MLRIDETSVYEDPFVSLYLHEPSDVKEGKSYRFKFCGSEFVGVAVKKGEDFMLQVQPEIFAKLKYDGFWKAVSLEGGHHGDSE